MNYEKIVRSVAEIRIMSAHALKLNSNTLIIKKERRLTLLLSYAFALWRVAFTSATQASFGFIIVRPSM